MGNLVVKSNTLITASHRLGETEQRLILLAILQARKHCKSVAELENKELIIHADDYAKTFGINRQMAYKALKQGVMGLFEAKWSYKYINKNGNKVVAYERFTQSAKYITGEGVVQFMFANAIIPMLVELECNFTSYEIEQVANLSSQYAMRLYEFFMQHLDKKTGKGWLKISLDDLRFRLGILPTEYASIDNFKRKVLELALKQINTNTSLKASYTQQKQGRKIVGFEFEFSRPMPQTPTKPKQPQDPFTGLTEPHREVIETEIHKYLDYKEKKGEIINDFYRQNITQKAIAEQWGIAEYEKEQAKLAQKEKARLAKIEQAKQKKLAEQAQKEKEQAESQAFIAQFESLPPKVQNLILNEAATHMDEIFLDGFNQSRAKNEAHKLPMYRWAIKKAMD